MKALLYQCHAGISGDMHLGAMVDRGQAFVDWCRQEFGITPSDWIVEGFQYEAVEDTVVVTVNASLPRIESLCNMTYVVFGDGTVEITTDFIPGSRKLPIMPRFGTQMVLIGGLDQVWPRSWTELSGSQDRSCRYLQILGRRPLGRIFQASGKRLSFGCSVDDYREQPRARTQVRGRAVYWVWCVAL